MDKINFWNELTGTARYTLHNIMLQSADIFFSINETGFKE